MTISPEELSRKLAAAKLKREQNLSGSVGSKSVAEGVRVNAPEAQRPAQKTVQKPQARALAGWSGSKPNQSRGKTAQTDVHRAPPHSVDAEQGVLGSMIISKGEVIPEVVREITRHYFYVPGHVTIYTVLCDLYESGDAVDLITVTQALRDKGLLDTVGGAAFVTSLFTFVPTAANVRYYIDIVREKFLLREMISTGNMLVRRAYGAQDDEVSDIVQQASGFLEKIKHAAGGPNGAKSFSDDEMRAFVADQDPGVLIGKRWLCRGFTSLLAGPAGAGKSTLEMQQAIYWGSGVPFCGIRPRRPLKSLILQAENDLGDSAEQYQGVLEGIAKNSDFQIDRELVAKNVLVNWIVGKSGFEFCGLLDQMIELHRPDIAWIDPLFAFAGCDLLKPKETTEFIRQGLYPIAVKRNVALLVVHHIGKSYRDTTEKEKWTDLDFQYLGFGTSEIQNAFRAVTILLPVAPPEGSHEKLYRLILSKRGNRAGARDPEGHATTNLYLAQSEQGIFWMQTSKPEKENKGGRPKETSSDDILGEMSLVTGWDTTELCEHMKKEHGMKERTFYRHWTALKKGGKIQLDSEQKWTKKD